ncbi:AAA domain-containing protein, partial [Psychrobacter sp. AOP31-A1-22]
KFSDQPSLKEKTSVQLLIDDNLLSSDSSEIFTSFEVKDTHFDDNYPDKTSNVAEYSKAKIHLKNFPKKDAVQNEFNDYIQNIWKPWVATEKRIRQSITLYSNLFMLNQKLQGNLADAQLELVWGIGIATKINADNESNSKQIKYPLLTQSVEITLDQKTMALLIKPTLSVPTLETEPFSIEENQGLGKLLKNTKAFYESENVLLNPFI